MNKTALWHQSKTEYSYPFDEKTLHIILRTAKNDCHSVSLIHGDPFLWHKHPITMKPIWEYSTTLMHKRYQNDEYDFYFIAVSPRYLRTKYAFLISSLEETFLFGSKRATKLDQTNDLDRVYDLSEFYNFPYLNPEDLHHTPSWVKHTVWYQIFTDRYAPHQTKSTLNWGKLPVSNHESFGGNLLGITNKLPYLRDLGITGIYFTPLFESPTAHKYDTTNYFKIDKQFGTNEDFRFLVQTAHDLGIKVMLDGVFNHCGYHHPFFQDVILHGEESMYKDCFYIDKFPVNSAPLNELGHPVHLHGRELNMKTFAFTPSMPKWNTSNPVASKHLLDCVAFWIKEYDIDGWRIDVSNEISHDFLRDIKKVSRKAKRDVFILGENWDYAGPWIQGDQLDAVMNYELSFPLWKFLEHTIDLQTFKHMMITYLATTPKNVMQNMMNIVGSHDTVRIKKRLNDDVRRVKLSYLFMFLSAGTPTIYYGDEVGMTGHQDPDNRRCMTWNTVDQDTDFYAFTKKLISLRNTHPSFSVFDYSFIDSNILLFTKKDGKDEILVFMNNGPQQVVLVSKSLSGNYIDLMTNKKVQLHDTIMLEEYAFLLLQKEN